MISRLILFALFLPLSVPSFAVPEFNDSAKRAVEQAVLEAAARNWEAAKAANLPAMMFRNISHDGLNMIYRRADGNIGWVDPRGSRGGEPEES